MDTETQPPKTTPCLWCNGTMEQHCKWSRTTALIVAILGIMFGVVVLKWSDPGNKMGGAFGIICIVISPMIAAQGRHPFWHCDTCGKKCYGPTPRRLTVKRVARILIPIILIIALIILFAAFGPDCGVDIVM